MILLMTSFVMHTKSCARREDGKYFCLLKLKNILSLRIYFYCIINIYLYIPLLIYLLTYIFVYCEVPSCACKVD